MNKTDFSDLVNDVPGAGHPDSQPAVMPQRFSTSAKYQIAQDTYTPAELRDVNKIIVTVPDTTTPIVVLFGSPSSGKTMALLRMIRFFESHGYTVTPESVFRPKTDKHYERMCKGLKDMVYSHYAPPPTDIISFMLVKVLDRVGNPICQILEAPGEHYFDGTASLTFPTYIHNIIALPNRKVWVFIAEQDWGQDQNERNLYAQQICGMQRLIPNDKVVFLFNKVDKHMRQYRSDGRPNKEVFFANIRNQYPNIFANYVNNGFFSKLLFGRYNFKVVCFSSGVFTDTEDGEQVWTLGNDSYCQEFWDAIK